MFTNWSRCNYLTGYGRFLNLLILFRDSANLVECCSSMLRLCIVRVVLYSTRHGPLCDVRANAGFKRRLTHSDLSYLSFLLSVRNLSNFHKTNYTFKLPVLSRGRQDTQRRTGTKRGPGSFTVFSTQMK